MKVRPVIGERALLLDGRKKHLVVADLHMGFETDVLLHGIRIPSQTKLFVERIDALLEKTRAKHLILLGDVKHQVPGTSYQELREIPVFMKHFSDKVKVTVVAGNHDADIDKMAPVDVAPSFGFSVENVTLFHGHAWPSADLLGCKFLVFSHIHPRIAIEDELGALHREHCWVFASLNKKISRQYKGAKHNAKAKVVIMPVFNEMLPGLDLGGVAKPSGFLSCVDLPNADIMLIDGLHLGKLKDIKRRHRTC